MRHQINTILLIGQCTLHWGRMEFGNIGNYYILEPLVRQIHKAFPGANLQTTFQLSDEFCAREKIQCLPMDLYYGYSGDDLESTKKELKLVKETLESNKSACGISPFVDEVLKSDLVIDFSGDIWGDNANFLGKDRFEVGLLKDLIAQTLEKPTVMIAGSPGPFSNENTKSLAQQVYRKFRVVTNRESISKELLENEGFDVSRTYDCACPAFLFEPTHGTQSADVVARLRNLAKGKPIVGLVVCGWNFSSGPFDKWPREGDEFVAFANIAKALLDQEAFVVCMSHSNGFDVPPSPFRLKQGRDFPIAQRVFEITKNKLKNPNLYLLEDILLPGEIKSVIGALDFLISGRVHAAVAGMSQAVPTAILDYGHEPKAHKLRGFAKCVRMDRCVIDPSSPSAPHSISNLFSNRKQIQKELKNEIPNVKKLAIENFNIIKNSL